MQENNLSRGHASLTWIHRLDPRSKMLLLAVSFVMVLLPQSLLVVALAALLVLGHVSLKRYLPLLAPIFLLTLRRSQSMARALESRGFQMSPHTYLLETHFSWPDGFALGLAAFLLAGFITLHVFHADRIPGLIA